MSEHEKLEQTAENTAPAPAKPAKAEKKKDSKADKSANPGFFGRIGKWFKEMRSELKKVQWPTPKQTANNTGIVILCVIVVGIFIWIFDAVAGGIIGGLISLIGG